MFTGLALTYVLGQGVEVLGYAILAGAVTAIAMLGPLNTAKPWRVPAHTYPFIFTSWIFLLAAYGFSPGESLPQVEELPPPNAAATVPQRIIEFLSGVLSSISQIYFKDHVASALTIIAGLAVSSISAALFAIGGALIAVATAHVFGVDSELISSGIQGFSPVLTAVAFGTVLYLRAFAPLPMRRWRRL